MAKYRFRSKKEKIKKNIPKGVFFILIVGLLLAPLHLGAVLTQEKEVDAKKLYAEISGSYEFETQGEYIVIKFYEENGVLLGIAEGDDEVVEILPLNLEKMQFEATLQDGQYHEVNFSRDGDGKLTKCVLITMGMEFEGNKIGG